MLFEFIIARRPVSSQTKSRPNLQAWKQYVRNEAAKTWSGMVFSGIDVQLTLVYLFDTDPVDVDNIVKPIQDALVGLIYDDDLNITDVEAHRRSLVGGFDVARLPVLLLQEILANRECVYVRISVARRLEDYL